MVIELLIRGRRYTDMPKVITFATLKGGAGKTMNLFNLSGIVAGRGKKVLLIDVDPQCNLSANAGLDVSDMGFTTSKDIFSKYRASEQPKAENVIIEHPIPELDNLDIIPSSILLFNVEEDITLLEGRTKILKSFVSRNEKALDKYDYIFIDTNPSMSVFNINAYFLADSILICTDVSSNGISGAELFCGLWDSKREQINETSDVRKEDNIKALLVGNYTSRNNLSKELLDYVHTSDFSKDIVLDTVIPSTVQLKDTEVDHKPINIIHKGTKAHQSYESLADELFRKGIL